MANALRSTPAHQGTNTQHSSAQPTRAHHAFTHDVVYMYTRAHTFSTRSAHAQHTEHDLNRVPYTLHGLNI